MYYLLLFFKIHSFHPGIGKAIVKRLFNSGATVYALSKSAKNLETLQQEVPGINVIVADLENWETTRNALKELPNQIHLLVNNAGIAVLEPFLDIKEENIDRF